ncbi:hypothetical protein ABEB36_000922 [Hypothenemus hampei]|uniref:MADF domain-containing protein n=1 Tax=Hypothenemus hampei TaxID=57062 RepID=A0ABD1FGG0_HYPHA
MMMSSKKWRESDTVKFVELYENAECLWNFRHPLYKHRNARDKAMQQILQEMNMPDFGINELKNKIKNIRSTYQQEVNKIKRSSQNIGGDIVEEYKTNLAWFPIADRFLGKVIHSTKNPVTKIEKMEKTDDEEQQSYFSSNQSALYNFVETEMTNAEQDGDLQNDNFTNSYSSTIQHIKEEVDSEDYGTVLESNKRRRLSNHVSYDLEPNKSDSSEVSQFNHNPLEDKNNSNINIHNRDEWYYFGNNVACQMRMLPLERALLCQKRIVDMLTEERIDYITKGKATS